MTSTRSLPLDEGLNDAAWADHAACRGADIELFFSLEEEDQQRALEHCRVCPVQEQCLRYAIENREMYGIWGGMTESERRAIIRDMRRRERERREKGSNAA